MKKDVDRHLRDMPSSRKPCGKCVSECTGLIGGFHGDDFEQNALPGFGGAGSPEQIHGRNAEGIVEIAGTVAAQSRELDNGEECTFDVAGMSVYQKI